MRVGSNSDTRVLHRIFESHVRPGDTLAHIGCGRGWVLAYWERAFPDLYRVRIEPDRRLASAAARRLAGPRCRVITGDPLNLLPEEATFVFMTNPPAADQIETMRQRFEWRPPQQPPLRIVYSNPMHLLGFEESSSWTVTRMRGRRSRRPPHHDYAVIDRSAKPPEPVGLPPSAR